MAAQRRLRAKEDRRRLFDPSGEGVDIVFLMLLMLLRMNIFPVSVLIMNRQLILLQSI